jgi:hypothetical protein
MFYDDKWQTGADVKSKTESRAITRASRSFRLFPLLENSIIQKRTNHSLFIQEKLTRSFIFLLHNVKLDARLLIPERNKRVRQYLYIFITMRCWDRICQSKWVGRTTAQPIIVSSMSFVMTAMLYRHLQAMSRMVKKSAYVDIAIEQNSAYVGIVKSKSKSSQSQNNFIHFKRAISIGSMQACLKRHSSKNIRHYTRDCENSCGKALSPCHLSWHLCHRWYRE